jgi:hypothetical protein
MARYLVTAQYTVNLYTYVEAESQEEAWDIAQELDGGEFKADENDDWRIDEVTEVDYE